ncbi:hypothetical protein GCM10007304_39390 [Rhodococcoides trifolii]|uniref:Polysaccharide biosynthesis protein n=1 Tax=Rhodococcoides trifolii TaxID=908250 RepID=A0A917G4Q4_9NOCA|nr:hypothetical protein GCM10007304_39390 [Rhodococcus trifolii]
MRGLGKYRKIIATAGVQASTTGLGLISGILIARTLGADGRGSITAVMIVLTVLSWLVFLGVPNAGGYMSTRTRTPVVTQAAATSVVLGALAGVVLWILAPSVAGDYPEFVTHGLRAAAVTLPFVGLGLCGQEILYAESRVKSWNVLRIVPLAGPSVCVIGLAAAGQLTAPHAVITYLASMIVYIVGGTAVLLTRTAGSLRSEAYGALITYAFPRWMSAASDAVTARMDQLVMVVLSTPSELGRYAVAVTVVSVSNPLSQAVGMMMYPETRNASGDRRLLHRATRRRAVMLSAAAGLVVTLVAAPLIGVLFGPDFRGLESIIVVLVIAQVFNDRYYVDISYFAGIGRPHILIVPSWITAAVMAAGLVVLGRGGLTGFEAASVTMTCAIVRCVAISFATRREERRHPTVDAMTGGQAGGRSETVD